MIFSRIAAGVCQSMRPQHQEAAVEPGREQMLEVGVDGRKLADRSRNSGSRSARMATSCGGAAGRQVEAAEQLLAPRLGRVVQGQRRASPGSAVDRRWPLRRCARGRAPNSLGQMLEEASSPPVVEGRIQRSRSVARHADARGLAAPARQPSGRGGADPRAVDAVGAARAAIMRRPRSAMAESRSGRDAAVSNGPVPSRRRAARWRCPGRGTG